MRLIINSLLRATFLALLALIITAQSTRLAESAIPAATGTLEQNLHTLGLNVLPSDIPDVLSLSAPGCAHSLHLTTVRIDGAGSATARYLLALPGEARFVYSGFVGRTPDPLQIAARWGIGTAQHVLGMRKSSAPRTVLLIMIPPSCPGLGELNWAELSPGG